MKIAIILLVISCLLIVWVVICKRSYKCPECRKRISKNNMSIHLKKCIGRERWYSLPSVPVSHIGALEVKRGGNKMWGIWDKVVEDWVRGLNKERDDRAFEINANKLLKLIKAKSRFNELVNKEKNARPTN